MIKNDDTTKNLLIYRYETELSKELADLYGVKQDLLSVIAYIEAIAISENDTIKSALFTASLIKYRRCFSTGIRNAIPNDLIDFGNGSKDYHKYKIDMASKLAAHSVNPFEQNYIVVGVQNEAVTWMSSSSMNYAGDTAKERAQFIAFVKKILEQVVNPKIEDIAGKVLAEAQKTPIDKIVGQGEFEMTVPGPEHAKKGRQKVSDSV